MSVGFIEARGGDDAGFFVAVTDCAGVAGVDGWPKFPRKFGALRLVQCDTRFARRVDRLNVEWRKFSHVGFAEFRRRATRHRSTKNTLALKATHRLTFSVAYKLRGVERTVARDAATDSTSATQVTQASRSPEKNFAHLLTL